MNISGIANLLAQQVSNDTAGKLAGSSAGDAGFFANPVVWTLGIILLGLPVATWIGRKVGSMVRTPENSWRIGLIFWFILVSAVVITTKPLKFGVDLRGGVTIIGQMNEQELEPGDQPIDIKDIIPQLKMRIDPAGTKEIVIRPMDKDKIEVIIPDVEKEEAERIWTLLTSAGQLYFRIVADDNNPLHRSIIAAARQSISDPVRAVKNEEGERIGEWYSLAREQVKQGSTSIKPLPFKFLPSTSHLVRDLQTCVAIDMSTLQLDSSDDDLARLQFSNWCEKQGYRDVEILMVHPKDRQNVEGKFLKNVSKGSDQSANPCIEFSLSAEGGKRLYALTQNNKPQGGRYSLLGIVLDGHLQSAPRINEPIRTNGQITGKFTDREIEDYRTVLSSGKLDVALRKNWISLDQIRSTLGDELKTKGIMSNAISLALVVTFMLVYYRFCGMVACLALGLNLLFSLGILILINVNLTLTGLAGFVLTIGMSVDANILIFERIREELERGSALRMAIRNGFDRAMSTIIDSNLTTLVTAIILYVVGTDQIRSFAVTLIVGILMCMFTAIFCARLIFVVFERNRWISELKMRQIYRGGLIDFVSKQPIATAFSILIIAVGIVALVARGPGILDTDLAGGSTARVEFINIMPVNDIKAALENGGYEYQNEPIRYEVTQMQDNDLAIKIDSSLPAIEDEGADKDLKLDIIIAQVFKGKLKMLNMDFDPARINIAKGDGTKIDISPSPQEPAAEDNSEPPAGGPNAGDLGRNDFRSTENFADFSGNSRQEGTKTETSATEPPAPNTPIVSDPQETTPTPVQPPLTPQEPAGQSRERYIATAELSFQFPMAGESVRGALIQAAQELEDVPLDARDVTLTGEGVEGIKDRSGKWKVAIAVYNPADAGRILAKVRDTMASQPYFASSSGVGGQVAGDTQWKALVAIIASCIGIIAYVWVRFQNVAYGLAAVIALVHDVLVTVSAIAISYYVSDALGFLLVDDFRISLSVIAALLTVIGFSVNDTIVVFDRIREIRGKRTEITGNMINSAVSQTLSRTILTSFTVFIVLVILYVWGGESIHPFAFAMLIGVVAGTYSTVFIAAPFLLWLMNRGMAPPVILSDKKAV